MKEFDLTNITNKIERLEHDLKIADQVNGKLIRLLNNVISAWHEYDVPLNVPGGAEMDVAMSELMEAME